LNGIRVHYVKTIDEVLEIALPSNKTEEKQDAVKRAEVLHEAPAV
jgi:predicted ATP-dependent protease